MAVYFLPKSRQKHFLARTDLPPDVVAIDVSAKAADGWNVFHPAFDHGAIPVPGMPGATSRTIDGIMEGLKRFHFENEDASSFESEKPKKRKPNDEIGDLVGHSYGGTVLQEALEARRRIFIPAFAWMARNAPAAKVKFDELVAMSETHTIHLHCGGENGNPHDPKTYAYSSLLAELVKEARKNRNASGREEATALPV
jgi:hypothetical protein